jgi:hypothetical protein
MPATHIVHRGLLLRALVALLLCLAVGARAGDDSGGLEPVGDDNVGTSMSDFLDAVGKWFYEDVILVPYEWGHGSWRRAWPDDRLVPTRLAAPPAHPGAEPNVTYPYRAEDRAWLAPRVPGEGTLPFARLDVAAQYDSDNQQLLNSRLELGFGPFAAEGQNTRIEASDTHFEIDRCQALLRLSLSEDVEVDVGGGWLFADPRRWHRGWCASLPVLIHPNESFGIEFRPTLGNVAGDNYEEYDVSAYFSYRFAALRIGYRWLLALDEDLSGPELGITLRY